MAPSGKVAIELNEFPISWDLDNGTLNYLGLESALFWLNPSLFRLLGPLVDEVGAPLFRLLVAYQSSLGTDQDYQAMVTERGGDFVQGFLAWGRAVAACGWGSFELRQFDPMGQRAVVRVKNPWELRMQAASAAGWGCPFLFGKIVGLFSQGFAVNCWADEIIVEAPEKTVEFHIFPSERTIAKELSALRAAHDLQTRQPLEEKIQELLRVKSELSEKLTLIQKQQEAIRALSTPILHVWEGVVALPLFGMIDTERAAEITSNLLDVVVRMRARYAILDLTGIDTVDTAAAGYLIRMIRGIALLGAECLVCGIRPGIAQAMVELGVGIENSRSFRTIQAALQAVISQRQTLTQTHP